MKPLKITTLRKVRTRSFEPSNTYRKKPALDIHGYIGSRSHPIRLLLSLSLTFSSASSLLSLVLSKKSCFSKNPSFLALVRDSARSFDSTYLKTGSQRSATRTHQPYVFRKNAEKKNEETHLFQSSFDFSRVLIFAAFLPIPRSEAIDDSDARGLLLLPGPACGPFAVCVVAVTVAEDDRDGLSVVEDCWIVGWSDIWVDVVVRVEAEEGVSGFEAGSGFGFKGACSFGGSEFADVDGSGCSLNQALPSSESAGTSFSSLYATERTKADRGSSLSLAHREVERQH